MERALASPGHSALILLREIVALLDRHPAARQYAKSPAVPGLQQIERRARELVSTLSKPASRGQVGVEHEFCGFCRGYHHAPTSLEVAP